MINEEGISTDPDKIRAVSEWSVPQSVKDVRAFVGLASYYRRCVRGFANIEAPLHQLMKKGEKFV